MYVAEHNGRKLKFVNAKAYRRWARENAAAYIPTPDEDVKAFNTPTLGVGRTTTHVGVSLVRSRKGGAKLGGKKVNKRFAAN